MVRFIRKATIVNASYVPAAASFGIEVSGYLNMHWHLDVDSLDKLGEAHKTHQAPRRA